MLLTNDVQKICNKVEDLFQKLNEDKASNNKIKEIKKSITAFFVWSRIICAFVFL